MDLSNINLLQLMTQYMQSDPSTIALCDALDPQLQDISNEIISVLIYANLDNVPEVILDEVAWGYNIEFYDAGSDIELKRKLVNNAIIIHRTKGTPFAVKKLIEDVFGYGDLLEWFQYSGDPYNFKVRVEHTAGINIPRFLTLINSVKNSRSFLEAIELTFRGIIGIKENIYKRDLTRHTKLGIWRLGYDPFATVSSEVTVT